jgi:hypothetical protein
MAMLTSGAISLKRTEHRSRTSLLLESIALRHQIAVLERCRTRRPCFRRLDRLFWILLSRWWLDWREGLVIVQPETVLRWRRDGWSALWKYRSRGRRRGGRPRVSGEIRGLISRMAFENFLWGAPRIHGELLMLGFSVSQATVSRYLPAPGRRPRQSWRTFLRNQASAFGQYSEERADGYIGPQGASYSADLMQSAAARITMGQQQPTLPERVNLRSAQCHRGATHGARRVACVRGGSRKASENRSGAALSIRSPPPKAWASPC